MKVRLLVAYDGSEFHGFARNDPHPTVGGFLEEQISRVLREPISVTCAGRTDRGVHAWGQVVSFEVDSPIDAPRLARSLNSMGGGSVVIRDVALVDDSFDARFSAEWRRYRYTVVHRDVPDPFLRHTAWWVPERLSLDALRQACIPLIGTHDFAAFCRRPKPAPGAETAPSLVRHVLAADWTDLGDGLLRFEIRATAFCHQMVRSIVGTLVEAGRGRLTAADVESILSRGDRAAVHSIAPPHGLCLWDVGY